MHSGILCKLNTLFCHDFIKSVQQQQHGNQRQETFLFPFQAQNSIILCTVMEFLINILGNKSRKARCNVHITFPATYCAAGIMTRSWGFVSNVAL